MPTESMNLRRLVQHPYLAILATVYTSGGPQAFPVWYEYDGVHFLVTTEASAIKVRNIRRNPKVALCITDTSHHTQSVTVLGHAEIVDDNQFAQEVHRRLSYRYLGPEEGEEWANSMADLDMVLIRITPEKYLWSS